MAKRKVVKWFEAGRPLGWRKQDSQTKRRAIALRNRDGDYLKAGRALQALANVNSGRAGDRETARKASADASYMFAQHRKKQSRGK